MIAEFISDLSASSKYMLKDDDSYETHLLCKNIYDIIMKKNRHL